MSIVLNLIMSQKIFKFILLIIIFFPLIGFASTENNNDQEIIVYLFDDRLCPVCRDAKNFLEQIKDDYPKLTFETKKKHLKLNSDLFRNVINKTLYAASQNEERANLTGLNIKIKNNVLKCSATDSYRIAIKKITLEEKYEEVYIRVIG